MSTAAILSFKPITVCSTPAFDPVLQPARTFPAVPTWGHLLTYVQVAGAQMTYRNWIDGIAKGRTVISRNGHNEFLSLTVNGSATPGDEINLTGGGTVTVAIQWTANQNLSGTIELVKNGVVVASAQDRLHRALRRV